MVDELNEPLTNELELLKAQPDIELKEIEKPYFLGLSAT